MPVEKTSTGYTVQLRPDVQQKVGKLMAENGFATPVWEPEAVTGTGTDTDSDWSSYLGALIRAVHHVEDKSPKHFQNPTRKIQVRYIDPAVNPAPWLTIRTHCQAFEPGWYAITPIGRHDAGSFAVAHGPYSYRRALMLAVAWIRNFYGENGNRYQAEFWQGPATEKDIEIIRSAAQTVGGGIPIPGTEIHEVAIDRRDGRTLWESRYPHAGPVTEGAKPVRWEDR
ncbi:hypothetical protein SEA_Phreeze_85 [Mycobacterium phage Phreeze]|nr:hypothetical protein SEA_Phreeze_85 [Mycobacterium phage Phreeze]